MIYFLLASWTTAAFTALVDPSPLHHFAQLRLEDATDVPKCTMTSAADYVDMASKAKQEELLDYEDEFRRLPVNADGLFSKLHSTGIVGFSEDHVENATSFVGCAKVAAVGEREGDEHSLMGFPTPPRGYWLRSSPRRRRHRERSRRGRGSGEASSSEHRGREGEACPSSTSHSVRRLVPPHHHVESTRTRSAASSSVPRGPSSSAAGPDAAHMAQIWQELFNLDVLINAHQGRPGFSGDQQDALRATVEEMDLEERYAFLWDAVKHPDILMRFLNLAILSLTIEWDVFEHASGSDVQGQLFKRLK